MSFILCARSSERGCRLSRTAVRRDNLLTCTPSVFPDAAPFDRTDSAADPAETLSWVAMRASPPVGEVRASTLGASVGVSVGVNAESTISNEAAAGREGDVEVFVVLREGRPPS